MLRAVAPFLFFSLLILSSAPALTDERRCDSWHALYGAPLGEGEGRVIVRFSNEEASQPQPLYLTGLSPDGKRLWQHKGHAWCYQGSGGCYAGLTYKDKKRTEDEGENSLRLVFANARPGASNPDRAADILVIAGINSAFFYGQNGGGLVIDHSGPDGEPVFIPEVFYFDRCEADK